MLKFPLAPPQASNIAKAYDPLFNTLLALTVIFTLIVCVCVIFFAIRYREGSKADRSRPLYEHLTLELTWTIIPTILGLVMFVWGTIVFIKMKNPPKDSQEIFVIGKQWMWHVEHSNGVRENNTLHVPVGRNVKLTMISEDVLHAFYIPAFRVQMGVVPGRYTTLWFNCNKAGEYHIFCNMYCGTQHSEMGGKVVAMEPKEFEEWLANGGQSSAPMSMEQAGAKVYAKVHCDNCHGKEDNLHAPSLYGIYGKRRVFADGTSLIADNEYLRESIVQPYNHITAGYGQTMPAYQNQLSEVDLINLVAYIKSLGSTIEPAPSSLVNRASAITEATHSNSSTTLKTNAEQYNEEDHNATPTHRGKAPAVGAIAAEGKDR